MPAWAPGVLGGFENMAKDTIYKGGGRIPMWGIEERLCGLKRRAILLYCSLCARSKSRTGKCWPGLDILSRELRMHRKYVLAALRELAVDGLVAFSKDKSLTDDFVFWIAQTERFRFHVDTGSMQFSSYNLARKSAQIEPTIGSVRSRKSETRTAQSDPVNRLKVIPQTGSIQAKPILGFRPQKSAESVKMARYNIEGNIEGEHRRTYCAGAKAPGATSMASPSTSTTPGGDDLSTFQTETAPAKDGTPPAPQSSMLDSSIPADGFETIETPSLKKRGRPLSEHPGPAQQLLGYHCANFKKLCGFDYIPEFGKDIKLAKQLLSVTSLERLKLLNDDFFAKTDEFNKEVGYTFGLFKTQINKLNVARASTKPRKTPGMSSNPVGKRVMVGGDDTHQFFDEWDGARWKRVSVLKEKPS